MPLVGGIAAETDLMRQLQAQDADLAQICPGGQTAVCCSAAAAFSSGLPHDLSDPAVWRLTNSAVSSDACTILASTTLRPPDGKTD